MACSYLAVESFKKEWPVTYFKTFGESRAEEHPETELDRIIRKHYDQPCGHGCRCHNGRYCKECHGSRPPEASV